MWCIGGGDTFFQNYGGETEISLFGRPKKQWENNVEINLQQIGMESMN